MPNRIQVRRGTSTQWTTSNPTLSEGEIGFDTTTNTFKIGTGTTAWSSLTAYFPTISSTDTLTNKTINLTSNTLVATSAQLATAVTDETGSGSLVFATSPTLAGTPLSTTAAADTNTTQIATTAFVIGQASAVNPSALGTVAVGTSLRYARADHVHPTTGLGLTSGTLAQFAATTSAQLAGVISDETGSGSLVFGTSPTLSTPVVNQPSLRLKVGSPDSNQGDITLSATGGFITLNNGSLFQTYVSTDGTQTLTNKTLTSPTVNTPTMTLATASSTTDARISWDTTNKKIQVGNGTIALDFASSTLATNAQTGTTYTLVLADKDKLVEVSNAGAITVTVPTNATAAFPTGTQINILQTGAGQITIAGAGGVTVNGTPGLKLRAQWSSATLIKRGTDTWVVVGDLAA